jgi:hypothetical protein
MFSPQHYVLKPLVSSPIKLLSLVRQKTPSNQIEQQLNPFLPRQLWESMNFLRGSAFLHPINPRMAHPNSPDVRAFCKLLNFRGQVWASLRIPLDI